MFNRQYYKQTELLLKALPIINRDSDFALKGGTAINFFIRNLPRLSVDIDLVYLPIKNREETLSNITAKLRGIGKSISSYLDGVEIFERSIKNTEYLSGINVKKADALIKIETNTVIRGSVYEPLQFVLCAEAQNVFEIYLKMRCLSVPDLYGGKICAALDRQHPRDLFDIKLLLDNEGFTEEIKKAFLVYLISHDRPISELLDPRLKDISTIFAREFTGMTDMEIELHQLTKTFYTLKELIITMLTDNDKEFLLSFKRKEPKWDLLGLANIENLPAVKWKLFNIEQMDSKKRKVACGKLEMILTAK